MNEPVCTHLHDLVGAEVGELVDANAPRYWTVVEELQAIRAKDSSEILLPAGLRLRYDQRDYDIRWRHQGWDRFMVLDGPMIGSCVIIEVPMPGSPVHRSLVPTLT